jgi:hypothetical protein
MIFLVHRNKKDHSIVSGVYQLPFMLHQAGEHHILLMDKWIHQDSAGLAIGPFLFSVRVKAISVWHMFPFCNHVSWSLGG